MWLPIYTRCLFSYCSSRSLSFALACQVHTWYLLLRKLLQHLTRRKNLPISLCRSWNSPTTSFELKTFNPSPCPKSTATTRKMQWPTTSLPKCGTCIALWFKASFVDSTPTFSLRKLRANLITKPLRASAPASQCTVYVANVAAESCILLRTILVYTLVLAIGASWVLCRIDCSFYIPSKVTPLRWYWTTVIMEFAKMLKDKILSLEPTETKETSSPVEYLYVHCCLTGQLSLWPMWKRY